VLPLILFWNGSKRKLVLALALAFFVFVAAYDIVLAYQVPIVLVVIHGIEVLVDSLIYAWLLATLLAREGLGSEWRKTAFYGAASVKFSEPEVQESVSEASSDSQ
ncbi:MAG: hypothetical protein ACE5JR_13455, partial [Gemmatimonadota bacterium]